MKILLTGANGRLGTALKHTLTGHDVTGVDIDTVDITHWVTARDCVQSTAPELIIHAAAWTDVDGCARDPERAYAVNGLGTGNIAAAANQANAAVLYVSSNEVFDGTAGRPYYEHDPTQPTNPYGYSKWAGEQALTRATGRHYIVRTSWLFAHGGKNFIQAMLGAAEAGKTLRVVIDEVANPTYTDDLADAIAQLITTGRYGTYHLVNEGRASRWAFARYALDRAGYTDVPMGKISRTEWPRPSTPPMYSSLRNVAAAGLGIRLRPWQQAVDAFLEKEGLLA